MSASAGTAAATGRDSTRDAILDATMQIASEVGLARLSVEDVAERAGLSRQTLYRYFGSRDGLLSAAILREEHAFIARIVDAVGDEPDLHLALRAAVVTALVAAREHPLLDRLLATEPEGLLPILLSGDGPVIPAARPAITEMLAVRLPGRRPAEVAAVADICTRLIVSYALNPPDDDPAVVAELLAGTISRGFGA